MVSTPSYVDVVREIEKLQIPIVSRLLTAVGGDTHASMSKSIGLVIQGFVDTLETVKPDWVILAGDRAEQLGAAIASTYMYIPTAHIQAGERSGNIDGVTRHAITKLVHLHFSANTDATNRLLKMGEEEFRITESGAPQIDSLISSVLKKKQNLIADGLVPNGEYFTVCFHPVTEEFDQILKQIENIFAALNEFNESRVFILPNNDAGGDIIRNYILENKRLTDKVHNNLKREDYFSILKNSKTLIGNSSSGILEASSLKIPVVNIGRRQENRFRPKNVIDVSTNTSEIVRGMLLATSERFMQVSRSATNPYGNGTASQKILEKLRNTNINNDLLIKNMTY
jgi:GDP/UDP-N,N'-diacetylbacillosamine 2-epimerase (hydrolysing)